MELKYLERDGVIVNRSHAAAYAFIAYQCAYLKYHYPLEFYTALLTVFGENEEKAAHYIQDARAHGFTILAPDLNQSEHAFRIISEREIMYGFDSMKGLKATAVEAILRERPFASIQELITKIPKKELDKTSIQVLSLSGVLDSFMQENENRMSLLSRCAIVRGDEPDLDSIKDFTNRKKLQYEKSYLGAYLSGHPLDGLSRPVDWEEANADGNQVTALGVVGPIRRIITKKGDPMAFVQLEFLEQSVDGVFFPNVWQSDLQFRKGDPLVAVSDLLKEGMLVKVSGTYQEEENRKSFLVDRLNLPVRLNADFEQHIKHLQETIGIPVPEVEEEVFLAPRDNYQDWY